MKVEVKEGENRGPEYPHIGQCDLDPGLLVLFISKRTGTVISRGSSGWQLGSYAGDWSESSFTPFTGSVTLSN